MITATITGRDDISLKVLKALEDEVRVKDIPALFPVSIDQAKILSRYRQMLLKTKGKIQDENYERLIQLGVKSLKLAPLFRHKDWEGMNDVLSIVQPDTKREEIGLWMEALKEKRQRLMTLQEDVNEKRKRLLQQEKDIIQKQKELEQVEVKINEAYSFLKNYPKAVRDFLQEHIGLYQHELVLAKRLDPKWGKTLREKDIIQYDEETMVHRILDIDGMAQNLEFRIKRGYTSHWTEEKAVKIYGTLGNMPKSANYRLPTGLATGLKEVKEQLTEQLKAIKKEKKDVEQSIKQLKKAKPTTFLEAVETRSLLSVKEIEKHGKLQHIGMKWLYESDYVTIAEFPLPNKQKVDVIGYSRKGRIVIIEAKTSWQDWNRDQKWTSYLDYCDEFYFLVPPDVYHEYQKRTSEYWEGKDEVSHQSVGFLVWDEKNLKMAKESKGHMKSKHPTELLFEMAKKSNKKNIYGN